jgi:hypothetical protein
MKFKALILSICLVLLNPTLLFASGLSSGRSVGMAQAYTSVARGVESAFWNPANLGFSKTSEKNITLFSVGVNASNNALNLEQYNKYNGAHLTSEDKQTILDLIPSKGFNLTINADVLALGVSWYNFAFTVSGKGISNLFLPKDQIQLLFFGNEINDTILLSGSDGEAFTSIEYGLSYGRSIWKKDNQNFLCGIKARYIQGLIYQKVKEVNGEVLTLETGVNGNGNFAVQSAEGGKGYGLDFGFTLKYDINWIFGLSFLNLINQIKWNKKTEIRGYQVKIDSLLAENFDLDSMVTDRSYTESIHPFTTRMPISVQAGLAYQLKRTLLAFDLKGDLSSGMGMSKKYSASFGLEYKCLRWLDVRGGISLGEDEGIAIASGLGFELGVYNLDVGMAIQQGIWLTKSKGFCLAITNSFHF